MKSRTLPRLSTWKISIPKTISGTVNTNPVYAVMCHFSAELTHRSSMSKFEILYKSKSKR
jgi:hypothetical protein